MQVGNENGTRQGRHFSDTADAGSLERLGEFESRKLHFSVSKRSPRTKAGAVFPDKSDLFDLFHHNVFDRHITVPGAGSRAHASDGVNHVGAGDNLAEHGVAPSRGRWGRCDSGSRCRPH